ncbi:MAG: hypothetical protein K1X75_00155 [Leptospirales bacterium]|nr:hypothetical protein [Leptospirales bacterium]
MEALARRGLSVLLLLLSACASAADTSYEQLEAEVQAQPPVPESYRKLRVFVADFSNSANIESFSILPDGDYTGLVLDRGQKPGGLQAPPASAGSAPATGSETNDAAEPPTSAGPESEQTPARQDAALILRETMETELFQSGRFEIVPTFAMQAAMHTAQAEGLDAAQAMLRAAHTLHIDLIVLGDLTDFEIRNERSYWKVPLWAIVLVGSFFIRNDDLRNHVWSALLRAAFWVPLNSPFWGYGLEWENLELIVDMGLDVRAIDPNNGVVQFSDSLSISRKDRVKNLNLLIWASDNSVRITRSNAGRQMRFGAREMAVRLSRFAEAQQGLHSGL